MTEPRTDRCMPDITSAVKMVEINLFLFASHQFRLGNAADAAVFLSFPCVAGTNQPRLLQASAGDAAMIVLAFWIVAILRNGRGWIFHPSVGSLALFLSPGILMTVALEAMATAPLHRWTHAEAMPSCRVSAPN